MSKIRAKRTTTKAKSKGFKSTPASAKAYVANAKKEASLKKGAAKAAKMDSRSKRK